MTPLVIPPPFTLTHDEKHSPLWARLKANLVSELDIARGRNDRALSEIETATLRGEIRRLKEFISLGDDRPMTGDEGPP